MRLVLHQIRLFPLFVRKAVCAYVDEAVRDPADGLFSESHYPIGGQGRPYYSSSNVILDWPAANILCALSPVDKASLGGQ